MKKILGIAAVCALLTSCSHIMEPQQETVVSQVDHKPLKPFKPSQEAQALTQYHLPGTRKIAVLLPLSGQYSHLGQSMLHASELALFEATNDNNVVLIPKDTRGQVDGAHRAAQEAMHEGADIILGPIFSREVNAVKSVTGLQNVPILSFSTDTSVAGGGTYTLGFLPSHQVQHIIRFAAGKGHKNVVALTPKTEYGNVLGQALQSMRQKGEINLVDILPYEGSQMFTGSATLQQIIHKLQAAKAQGATAVLFPEAGIQLSAFVAALHANDLGDLKVLGTGQWDTPEIHRTPGLQGAWFAAPATQGRQRFESTYHQQFSKTPPRIATLAYDATALAIALAPHPYNAEILQSPHGFAGLDGLFRLRSDGTTERGLAVMEVSAIGTTPVTTAAGSF